MSNFKEKSQVFILGLMAGLIIAGGFFILKLDDYFKQLNLYKSVVNTFSHTSKNDETAVKSEDSQTSKKQESENKIKNKKETGSETSTKKNFDITSDTIISHAAKDSLNTSEVLPSDDIVVRKDELLFTKTLEVFNLNPVANHAAKDSLMQKVSGVTDDKNNSKQFFNIEFWTSPLNYKGYKMSKYKIVLYGITAPDVLKVYKLDDVIYLKNSGMVYQLDYANDFKQYERVTDETIINKLK